MDNKGKIDNAKKTLLGVSIGDAFGDSFFGETDEILQKIASREIPETKWEFTDDTIMSIAIFEELEESGEINQDNLIKRFYTNHDLDANRGYGATLRRLLREIKEGQNWKDVSKSIFDGQGSMGNGAAMRACPIGAYYFENIQKVKEFATKSAEVTHSNIEAITGALAISIGTALTTKMKSENQLLSPIEFIDKILEELPDSDTKSKISKSKSIPYNYQIETVKSILGNGTNMTAQDTVPFAVWCTAYNLENFEEALWKAVSILGDRDTICAMVGGMTIMSTKTENIPKKWITKVEKFETSIFRTQK
ncbi:ADP-ribosylglycohydrolase family protein [Flavobacterium sp.]|uniref:ADP-ribosylglycohydrolase family protein n=1 Tax=Flavobacterium sp. TaxID=239 RepID=UPI002B4ABDB6|nr:ADP-ribosylglycohydrolase family protein [Flavobacterium sp.]HLP63129.1 ADP-ribosylglycohydrolase family protein [Flavobacterium sp.]